MIALNNLSDAAFQSTRVKLDDGTILQITIMFFPATQHWVMNVAHPNLNKNGIQMVQHPNLIRQFKNVIEFGIAVTSVDGSDPAYIEDFASGRCSVHVLTSAAEVDAAVEKAIFLELV